MRNLRIGLQQIKANHTRASILLLATRAAMPVLMNQRYNVSFFEWRLSEGCLFLECSQLRCIITFYIQVTTKDSSGLSGLTVIIMPVSKFYHRRMKYKRKRGGKNIQHSALTLIGYKFVHFIGSAHGER